MSKPMEKPGRSVVKTIVLAAISLIVGLVLAIWPGTSSKVIAYILAGLVTLAGLAHVSLEYFRGKPFLPFPGLASGLTVLSIGVFLLIEIEVLMGILSTVLGIFVIYLGFVMLQTMIDFKKGESPNWWIPGVFALVTLIAGFLSLFNVFPKSPTLFLGISLVVVAALEIVSLILFGKNGPAPAAAPAPAAPEPPVKPEPPVQASASEAPETPAE